MKSLIAKLFALAAACLSLASAAEFSSDDTGIVVLDDSNFYTTAKEKKFMLTMFYAPWCSHCTTLEPEVKAAAVELQKHGLVIAVVNGDSKSAEKITNDYNIKSFP